MNRTWEPGEVLSKVTRSMGRRGGLRACWHVCHSQRAAEEALRACHPELTSRVGLLGLDEASRSLGWEVCCLSR